MPKSKDLFSPDSKNPIVFDNSDPADSKDNAANADSLQYLFGFHAVKAALRHEPESIISVILLKKLARHKFQPIQDLCKEVGLRIKTATREEMDALAPENIHQGVIAQTRSTAATAQHESDLPAILQAAEDKPFPSLVLVLDGVTDPHNLGACLRTADAAGVCCVIAPKDNAVGLTPVVRKVACGAAETMPFIAVTNLSRVLEKLKDDGFWIIGTSDKTDETLYQSKLSGKLVLVMGAEGKGLRQNTIKHCDLLVKLPMNGSVESLNVSVATGVSLYEIRRQHGVIS